MAVTPTLSNALRPIFSNAIRLAPATATVPARFNHNHQNSGKTVEFFVSSFSVPQLKERVTDYVRNHTSLKNPLRVVCIRDTENEDGFTVKEQSGDNIAMSSAFRETCILTQTSDDEFVTYLCKVLSIAPGAAEECTPKENIVVKEKEGVLLKQESSKSDRQQKQPTLDDYAEGQQ